MDKRTGVPDSWQECVFGLLFWLAVGISIAAVAALLLWAVGLMHF